MKYTSLLAAAVISTGCATATPYTGPTPEKIVQVDATASELFHGSRQWIAENFESAKNVIQYQDEATNTVIGRGYLPNTICIDPINNYVPIESASTTYCIDTVGLDFVMKIEAKDGRMKVSIPSATYFDLAKSENKPLTSELVIANSPKILGYGDEIAEYVTAGGSDW